jgi:hypothetical protein
VLEYSHCQISIATYIILVHMQYMQMFDLSFKRDIISMSASMSRTSNHNRHISHHPISSTMRKDGHITEVEMLFLPSDARTRHRYSTSCTFFSIFCNCALPLSGAAASKDLHQSIPGFLNHANLQTNAERRWGGALTSLHGDPHGALLRASLVHARQLAQEPIWLQHHLNKAHRCDEKRG